MSYMTKSQLRSFGSSLSFNDSQRLAKSDSGGIPGIFLSHSHKDKEWVEYAVNFFAKQGVTVYVDWKDGEMPERTSRVTADRLRKKIHQHNKFILLVTQNSLNSKWVPWELGVADSARGIANIAVFPIREDYGTFPGSEYVDLYPKIDTSTQGNWCVFPPGGGNGTRLGNWFSH